MVQIVTPAGEEEHTEQVSSAYSIAMSGMFQCPLEYHCPFRAKRYFVREA
jgi:hypothetical protein